MENKNKIKFIRESNGPRYEEALRKFEGRYNIISVSHAATEIDSMNGQSREYSCVIVYTERTERR